MCVCVCVRARVCACACVCVCVCVYVVQLPKSFFGSLNLEVSTPRTIRNACTHTHTYGRTPLNQWSARCSGRYLHNTQKTQETNTHALIGIRTRNTSTQVVPVVLLRPHCQHTFYSTKNKYHITLSMRQTAVNKALQSINLSVAMTVLLQSRLTFKNSKETEHSNPAIFVT